MAEDERDRLSKLAELRNSGVLSEEEYQNARARLVRARSQPEDVPPDRPSVWTNYWPAFVGLGVLIVLVLGVILYGRLGADNEQVDLNVAITNDLGSNVLEAAAPT